MLPPRATLLVTVSLVCACKAPSPPDTPADAGTMPALSSGAALASASAAPSAVAEVEVEASVPSSSVAPKRLDTAAHDKMVQRQLEREAEQMRLQMLKQLGGDSRVEGVLSAKDIPPADLNAAAGANGSTRIAGIHGDGGP